MMSKEILVLFSLSIIVSSCAATLWIGHDGVDLSEFQDVWDDHSFWETRKTIQLNDGRVVRKQCMTVSATVDLFCLCNKEDKSTILYECGNNRYGYSAQMVEGAFIDLKVGERDSEMEFQLDYGQPRPIAVNEGDITVENILREYVQYQMTSFRLADSRFGREHAQAQAEQKLTKAMRSTGGRSTARDYSLTEAETVAVYLYCALTAYCTQIRTYWRNNYQSAYEPSFQTVAALYFATHKPQRASLWLERDLVTYIGMNGAETPEGKVQGDALDRGDVLRGPWSTSVSCEIALKFARKGVHRNYVVYKVTVPRGYRGDDFGAIDVTGLSTSNEAEILMWDIPTDFMIIEVVE